MTTPGQTSEATASVKGQLTLKSIIIGCVGCIVITVTSAYVALKMGALPWPIIFAAIISLFFLRLCGSKSLNEANVAHTIMSSGAMVAGGMAFIIPGIWILANTSAENSVTNDISFLQMALIALCGVALGTLCSAVLRKHFIEDTPLEFPIGESAAQTLKAGQTGGKTAGKLFGAMGVAGIFTALRDWWGAFPTLFAQSNAFTGVSLALYSSPMMLAVGALVETSAVLIWFAGALFANFGIIFGGAEWGWWDTATGQGIASSLGMGVMLGCGIGVIVKTLVASLRKKGALSPVAVHKNRSEAHEKFPSKLMGVKQSTLALGVLLTTAIALILCFVLELGPLASAIVVLFVWVTSAMAAQSVGQTGIDPMEVFGLLILLLVAALCELPQTQLFFVAAVIAVACGLAGDLMNDYRAGFVLGTSPKAQTIGQIIGGTLGALISAGTLMVIVEAYGTGAFGTGGTFLAAQASAVALMVGGIPSLPAFLAGLVAGFVLCVLGLPVMLLGLGIYVPFYFSLTAFLGAMIRVIWDTGAKARTKRLPEAQRMVAEGNHRETFLLICSGVLGGESIVGVVIALIAFATGVVIR